MGGGGNSGMKRCQSSMAFSTSVKKEEDNFGELEPSSLFLSSSPTGVADERLYLPRRDTAPCSLDVYLQSIPSVTSRVDQLFEQQETTTLKKVASSQKCLTVLQGEVAHASEAQTDLLVSAEATTCHVVALRSTHPKSSAALASMAHIDEPDVYEECLEKMVQEHLQHHVKQAVEDGDDDFGFFMDDDESDDESDLLHTDTQHQHRRTPSFLPQPDFHSSKTATRSQSMPSLLDGDRIEMELHIAGGYLDDDGTSQGLSTSLIHSFSQLAHKYQDKLKISLSTAAISSMNTTTSSDGGLKQRPRSRGLALNTLTGEVTPVTTALPQELEGPALEVRNARLFSNEQQQRQLAVIHNSTSDGITIQPFTYQAQPQLNALLKVPDPVLLKVTSTSPDCESERFCSDLRRTLSFVNTVPAEQVFSSSKPLVYSRSSNALNEWEPVA